MNERIKAIADAATALFLQQGYARTQISHIAKAAGVSVGTIYLDFAGKKEILHFILQCTLDPDFAEQEFQRPITDALFADIEERIEERLEHSAVRFEQREKEPGYTFAALVSDAFDLMERYAAGCLFLEKNQFEFPRLGESYKRYRTRFLAAVERCLRRFMEQGTVRALEYPELSALLIVETLSWWAMDRRYTSFETKALPAGVAKAVCLDNLLPAYQTGSGPKSEG